MRKLGVFAREEAEAHSASAAEAIARREAGEAFAEIGRSYNVSHSTISRLALR